MNELHCPVDIHKWGSKEIIPCGNYQMINPVSLKQIKQINHDIRNGFKPKKNIYSKRQQETTMVMRKFIIPVLI
jgi:tRNA/tmRNA/rRNA uracil-C5-methylase (TrmA/RlmC/RlmD family)